MCGIFGIIKPSPGQSATGLLQKSARLLSHRGPDGIGLFEDEYLGLMHARLSILDLSAAANQPMQSRDGRFILIHNGEIYNHSELRKKYASDHLFASSGDTETLLVLWQKRGPSILSELVGMWAFAIWDSLEKCLWLSRDRYGQKPLFWIQSAEHGLCFSSEKKPLLELLSAPKINPLAVAEYLATGNYGHLGTQTFVQEIRQIPPASWVKISAVNPRIEPQFYWEVPVCAENDRIPLDKTSISTFRNLTMEAVQSQLLSDVPVGFTLSGGLDSSTIVSIVAATTDAPLPVFTGQVEGDTEKDETRFVQAMCKKWGKKLDVEFTSITRINLKNDLPKAIFQQEEPFGDPSIIGHGCLMDAAARRKVPVILGGQGGDEILAAYTWMLKGILAEDLLAGRIGRFLTENRAIGFPLSQTLRIVGSAWLPGLETALRKKSRHEARNWLSEKLKMAVGHQSATLLPHNSIENVMRDAIELSAIPHLTHYDDRSSMARGIESRMPFLDHRIVEFTASLQTDALLKNGRRKEILRVAFPDLLPAEILDRKDKVGFHTPLVQLMNKDAEWVCEKLSDDFCRQSQLFNPSSIQRRLAALQNGSATPADHLLLFRALSIRLWLELFNLRLDA